jgi:hypothetical protein
MLSLFVPAALYLLGIYFSGQQLGRDGEDPGFEHHL